MVSFGACDNIIIRFSTYLICYASYDNLRVCDNWVIQITMDNSSIGFKVQYIDHLSLSLSLSRYANRAKNIKNKPRINEDPKDALLREYQEEINRLKEALEKRKKRGSGRSKRKTNEMGEGEYKLNHTPCIILRML